MQSKPSVLIYTGNELDIKILRRILPDYDLTFKDSKEDVVEHAKQFLPDMILADVVDADNSPYVLTKMLKAGYQTAKIPVLFFLETIDQNQTREMFLAGGADYITKPFKQYEVQARLHVHLVNSKERKRLEMLAMYDPMTLSCNRKTFFEEGDHYLNYANEHGLDLSVILFTLTSLHQINDEYGHFMGDHAIKDFAKVVQSNLPNDAMFARLGGKVFGVITLGNDRESDHQMTQDIVDAAMKITIKGSTPVKIQFSLENMLDKTDTLDAIILRASRKIEQCFIAREVREYL